MNDWHWRTHRRGLGLLLVAIFGLSQWTEGSAADEGHLVSARRAFSEKMTTICKGMGKETVHAALGPPDSVRTGTNYEGVSAIWCYGVHGPHQFPTLGTVLFDGAGRVAFVRGGKVSALQDEQELSETELRTALAAIAGVGSARAANYDPGAMIRAVNVLMPRGKDLALTILREYVRVAGDDEAALLVLRVLFDLDDGRMPRLSFGAALPRTINTAELERIEPRYPLIIYKDVPLLFANGYILVGRAPDLQMYLPSYKQHGSIRREKLIPPDDIHQYLSGLRSTNAWKCFAHNNPQAEEIVCLQLLNMCGNILPANLQPADRSIMSDAAPQNWAVLSDTLRRTGVQWDRAIEHYRLPAGR